MHIFIWSTQCCRYWSF